MQQHARVAPSPRYRRSHMLQARFPVHVSRLPCGGSPQAMKRRTLKTLVLAVFTNATEEELIATDIVARVYERR